MEVYNHRINIARTRKRGTIFRLIQRASTCGCNDFSFLSLTYTEATVKRYHEDEMKQFIGALNFCRSSESISMKLVRRWSVAVDLGTTRAPPPDQPPKTPALTIRLYLPFSYQVHGQVSEKSGSWMFQSLFFPVSYYRILSLTWIFACFPIPFSEPFRIIGYHFLLDLLEWATNPILIALTKRFTDNKYTRNLPLVETRRMSSMSAVRPSSRSRPFLGLIKMISQVGIGTRPDILL